MSLNFTFSSDSRELFAYFLKTVVRLSYDIRMSVAKFSLVNSPIVRGDSFATLARTAYDSLATYFGEKLLYFLNM